MRVIGAGGARSARAGCAGARGWEGAGSRETVTGTGEVPRYVRDNGKWTVCGVWQRTYPGEKRQHGGEEDETRTCWVDSRQDGRDRRGRDSERDGRGRMLPGGWHFRAGTWHSCCQTTYCQ